jgi:hypothetical protein
MDQEKASSKAKQAIEAQSADSEDNERPDDKVNIPNVFEDFDTKSES